MVPNWLRYGPVPLNAMPPGAWEMGRLWAEALEGQIRSREKKTEMMRAARRDETNAQIPARCLRRRGCEMFASPLLLALIIPNSQNRSCRLGRKANCKN